MTSIQTDRNVIEKNRLQKKIDKLIKQRDHWKEQHDILDEMVKRWPYIRSDYNSYQRDVAKREEHNMLSKRVREQELLIRVLLKDETLRAYEIQKMFRDIIAEENQKLNEMLKKAHQ